jgi:hypothetical protein
MEMKVLILKVTDMKITERKTSGTEAELLSQILSPGGWMVWCKLSAMRDLVTTGL